MSLTLVSVSGAQAVGKTTLLNGMAEQLAPQGKVVVTPSFGSALFRRWREHKLQDAPLPVATFDDIDRRGHREWFQRKLPDALSFEVERALQEKPRYILVDRWFPDIMAHTRLGLPRDEIACRQIRRMCSDRHAQIVATILDHCAAAQVLHVFVPVAFSSFPVEGQDGKFRATTDRREFERLCLEEWPLALPRLPDLTISTTDLNARLLEVRMLLNKAPGSR